MPRRSVVVAGTAGELAIVDWAGAAAPELRMLLDPEDPRPSPLSDTPAAFVWPTWTAAGDALLTSTLPVPGSESPACLVKCALDGGSVEVLYRNPDGTTPLGPGLPHYINPSPDGRHIALLTQTLSAGLMLVLVDVDAAGRGPGQLLTRGAPLFTAWSPASDALLMHAGGELSLMEAATAPSSRLLAANHVGYRVPAWSPEGSRIAVIAPHGDRLILQILDRSGELLTATAVLEGPAAVAWSPDGATLALAEHVRDNTGRYTGLRLVSASGETVRSVESRSCLAFIWSPIGTALAVLQPAARDGEVSWLVVDREGRQVRRFPAFEPSAEFGVYTTFFDQYALSHRLWSADGGALLACGRMQLNGTPPELMGPSIYVQNVASGSVESVAAGRIAFWSGQA